MLIYILYSYAIVHSGGIVRMKKKIICVIVSIVMCLSLMPAPVFAEGHDLTVMNLDGLAEEGTDYEWDAEDPNKLIIKAEGLTVSGDTEKEYIVTEEGVSDLTIDGLTVSGSDDAIEFFGDCELILKGNNNLSGEYNGLVFYRSGEISGSGNLTTLGEVYVIYAYGALTISASGNITVDGIGTYAVGIYSQEDLEFTNAVDKVLVYGENTSSGAISWGAGSRMIIANGLTIKGLPEYTEDESAITGEVTYKPEYECVKAGNAVAKSVLITATTQAETYTVKFDANTGSGSMEDESFKLDEEKALTANAFTKTGYSFKGWAYDQTAVTPDFEDSEKVKNLATENGAEVTLYAIWSAEPRVISYQPVQTGAETPESKTTNVVYDGPIRLILEDESFSPAVKGTYTPPEGLSTSGKPNIYIVRANLDIGKAAAPDKYVFIGWDYTNLDGIPTYTARFRSFGYTVKFDANTGSGSMEDESFLYNEEKALTANAFTKTGYSFKGWAYDPEAYTPDLADGEAVKNLATEDGVEVTLYALWKIKDVEIKYQPEQPGDEVPDSIPTKDVFRYSDTIFVDPGDGTWTAPEGLTESEYEDVYIITSETGIDIGKALAPDGKVFLGWRYKTSAFTAIYADDVLGGKDPKTGEDLADGVPDKYQHYSEFNVLHGTWNDGTKDKIKEYATLYKYNPDGMFWFEEGSGHLKESQVPTGMIADTGYKAGAWTIFPDGTARTVKQIADDYVTHQWASREYYKYRYEFMPISYTVKFDANTGNGTMTDMSFLYDEEKALSANIFTKEGFNFLGWSTDAEATEAEYEDGATVKNLTAEDGAEVTLYAVWEHANHSYGPASYSWDGDQCTATRVCSGCAEGTKGHSETETKKGVYVKDTDATCDKAETGHYEVAKFDNPAFEPQQSEKDTAVNGDPKGHDYKAEQYNEEQHRLVCRNDESHSYMEDHTFAGNKCTACGYVRSDNPQTGDDSNMILWLAIAAGAALLGVTALRRRKKMR